MEFKLHTTFDSLAPFARAWDDMLAESITDAPFLRFEYLRDWWQTLGGGEWPQAALVVVTAHESDSLIGVAPLFESVNRDGQPALRADVWLAGRATGGAAGRTGVAGQGGF